MYSSSSARRLQRSRRDSRRAYSRRASAVFSTYQIASYPSSQVRERIRKYNGVAVLLGNGKGGFGRPTTYTIEGGLVASGITKADFNGDGKLDIAATSVNSFEFSIFRGNDKGGFGAAQSFKLQIGEPTNIVASDFNNDRRPDIGLGKIGPGEISVFVNTTPRR